MTLVEPDVRAANRSDSLYKRYIFPQTVLGSSSFPGTIVLVVVRGLKAGLSACHSVKTGGLEVEVFSSHDCFSFITHCTET